MSCTEKICFDQGWLKLAQLPLAPNSTSERDCGNTGGGASTGSASGRTHTVASGENLSKISQRYGVTTDALMRANNITNPNFVRAGQKLTIP